MRFAIMNWVSEYAKPTSIFGVFDNDNPAQLPYPTPGGYWEDFRVVDEIKFPLAAEAKAVIAKQGYYLVGAGLNVQQAFGGPPQR